VRNNTCSNADQANTRKQAKAEFEQQQLKERLDSSLQRQEYTRGQLDSISVMIGKMGDKSNDSNLRQLAETIAAIGPKEQHKGKISVPSDATRVTIIHGFTDPNLNIVVSAVPSWNTVIRIIEQDATSVTFEFNVPAPSGGTIGWKAS
jgi:hypothetical protein